MKRIAVSILCALTLVSCEKNNFTVSPEFKAYTFLSKSSFFGQIDPSLPTAEEYHMATVSIVVDENHMANVKSKAGDWHALVPVTVSMGDIQRRCLFSHGTNRKVLHRIFNGAGLLFSI